MVRHAPEGWKAAQQILSLEDELSEETEWDISEKTSRKAWARLIAKIYEIDPCLCPKCGSEMKIVAIIQDVAEIRRILKHFSVHKSL